MKSCILCDRLVSFGVQERRQEANTGGRSSRLYYQNGIQGIFLCGDLNEIRSSLYPLLYIHIASPRSRAYVSDRAIKEFK